MLNGQGKEGSNGHANINIKKHLVLGGDIGTCPNIEVKIDVMDKSPFFIRLYLVKEEDKTYIDKEMKFCAI